MVEQKFQEQQQQRWCFFCPTIPLPPLPSPHITMSNGVQPPGNKKKWKILDSAYDTSIAYMHWYGSGSQFQFSLRVCVWMENSKLRILFCFFLKNIFKNWSNNNDGGGWEGGNRFCHQIEISLKNFKEFFFQRIFFVCSLPSENEFFFCLNSHRLMKHQTEKKNSINQSIDRSMFTDLMIHRKRKTNEKRYHMKKYGNLWTKKLTEQPTDQ